MSNIFDGKNWCKMPINGGGFLHTKMCNANGGIHACVGIHASVTDYENGEFIPGAMYRGNDSTVEFVLSFVDRKFYSTLAEAQARAEELAINIYNKYVE